MAETVEEPEKETRETSPTEALNNIASRLEGSRVLIAQALGRGLNEHLEELKRDYADRRDRSQSPEDFLKAKGGYNLEGFRLLPTQGWEKAMVGDHLSAYSQKDTLAVAGSEETSLRPWFYKPPRIEKVPVPVESDFSGVTSAQAAFQEGYVNLEHPDEKNAGCRLLVKVATEDIDYKGGRMPKGEVRGMVLAIPRRIEVTYLESTAKA